MLSAEADTTAPDAGKGCETRDFCTILANIVASQFPPKYFSGVFARNIFPMARKAARIRKVRPVPKSGRIDVTHAEFARVIDLLNERGAIINDIREHVERNTRDLELQFTRLAQIQADLDLLKRMLAKVSVT
jgi:hypothetical protein